MKIENLSSAGHLSLRLRQKTLPSIELFFQQQSNLYYLAADFCMLSNVQTLKELRKFSQRSSLDVQFEELSTRPAVFGQDLARLFEPLYVIRHQVASGPNQRSIKEF